MTLLGRWRRHQDGEMGGREGSPSSAAVLVDGVDYGEAPRWHDGRWWYCHFYERAIYAVTEAGERTVEYRDLPDHPSALGWTPDGSLLVAFRNTRSLMRDDGSGTFTSHADLGMLVSRGCNDLIVDDEANSYATALGSATVALVRPDGSAMSAVEQPLAGDRSTLLYSLKGGGLTSDGSTMIVSQPALRTYIAFDVTPDKTLGARRNWATLPKPWFNQGCSLDTDGGIWTANIPTGQVVRVTEGGTITDRIDLEMNAYDCALGGVDGRTLFILAAPPLNPGALTANPNGAIYTARVAHARAGRP